MGPKQPGRKEKLAAKAAQLEAQRREQEEKEEKERQEQEKLQQLERARQEKRRREEQEMFEKSVREEILQGTCDFFNELIDKNFEHRLNLRETEEWERYLACDRLPYPNEIPSMNTYLYLWHETEETARMEQVFEKNETMLRLLNLLEDYIDEPLDATARKMVNLKEVRENYRRELREKMDLACFHVIRDIEMLFNRINYWEADFQKSSDNIELNMWAWMVRTAASSLARPAPSKSFPSVMVKLPTSFGKSPLILRVLHETYDHYSDQCRTWNEPANPVDHDLYDETTMWHDIKVDLIRENFIPLRDAEEIPCWFEVPEEYLDSECVEESEEYDFSGQQTTRTDHTGSEIETAEIILSDGKRISLISSILSSIETKKDVKEKLTQVMIEEEHKVIEPPTDVTDTAEEQRITDEQEQLPSSEGNDRPQNKKVYVGTFPVEGRPEYYKITSDGTIDVIKTIDNNETNNLDDEDNDSADENVFLDWQSITSSLDLDLDDYILERVYGNKENDDQMSGGKRVRTLLELLQEVSPKSGGLSTLNMSDKTRSILGEIFGITIKHEKKKTSDDDLEREKVYKPLKILMSEAQSRYMEAYKKELKLQIGEFELNLRKYVVLGGVYHIDLVHQVPQPHKHKDGTIIQINYGDYNISKEDYFFKYIPPMITEEEENEDDEGKPPVDDDIDKLIYVEIQVSEAVLWFETPTPYLWDETNKIWSSENTYDIRFNEEKQVVSFRIGKTCPIGIATFRYYNLPYQTWEIRPSADWKESKSIIFSLTASTVIVEYLIQTDKVSLMSIQNATGGALDAILGIPYPPNKLIRIMRQAGLDLFPGWDAFLYVEGNSAKKKVLEEHVYLSMSMFSPSFQYTWSRWNLPAGPDRVVIQMREYLKPKDPTNYSMMLSTTHKSLFVNCTDVSPQFTEEPAKQMNYQPDLFNLIENSASEKAKKRAKKTSQDLVFTLYEMLVKTKILSFS